jgi:hypothetical protein
MVANVGETTFATIKIYYCQLVGAEAYTEGKEEFLVL